MPRQGRLNGNVRNDTVTNLANQYYIRSLSQHRPEYLDKRQTYFFLHVALIHPCEVIFHGVLSRDDLLVGLMIH